MLNRFNRIIKWPHKIYGSGGGKLRRIPAGFIMRLISWYYHCDIPYSLDVSGCFFCHNGFGVVINPRTEFGKKVTIQHGVTIGEIGDAVPIIGNNVYIGAKSTIIGGVKIGDNAKIGAGALVLKDVPEGCTAVGVPARIINKNNGEKVTEDNSD